MAGRLPEHTARGAAFVKATRRLLELIYREGYGYKKAGVKLYDIRPARPHQESFFGRRRVEDEQLMAAVDRVNAEYGTGTVRVAITGRPEARDWVMKRQKRSPRYTTRWDELPTARAE